MDTSAVSAIPGSANHKSRCIDVDGLSVLNEDIYEEFGIQRMLRLESDGVTRYIKEDVEIPIVTEVSLRILVNSIEMASLLCLSQQQVELALGFLFSEGIIGNMKDVEDAKFNPGTLSVSVVLAEGISLRRGNVLRSVTAGCGKCFTYINPLRESEFKTVDGSVSYRASHIMEQMDEFVRRSAAYRLIGGVHSLLFSAPGCEVFCEDIGRHNCLDKTVGSLLLSGQIEKAASGIIFISGRVTSEIITKAIRLGVPIVVSKSTPSTSAIKLAERFNVTLMGYVKDDTGYIYSGAERLIFDC
jgi:FdhD protein